MINMVERKVFWDKDCRKCEHHFRLIGKSFNYSDNCTPCGIFGRKFEPIKTPNKYVCPNCNRLISTFKFKPLCIYCEIKMELH